MRQTPKLKKYNFSIKSYERPDDNKADVNAGLSGKHHKPEHDTFFY